MINYPDSPGYKEPTTSKAAAIAEASRSETLRERVYNLLCRMELTADECAENLRESILSVRPRLSELRLKGRIQQTGRTRHNASGHRAIVWRGVKS